MPQKIYAALRNLGQLTLLSLLFACGKQDVLPEKEPENRNTVAASVQGRVLTDAGKAAAGITVKTSGHSTITDPNGEFRFENIQVPVDTGYVTVDAEGFFSTGKTFKTNAGNTNYTEMQLIPLSGKTAVPSATAANVPLPAGGNVQLPANGYVTDGEKAPYNGEVGVYTAYLSPGEQQSTVLRPGSYTGYDKTGKEKSLRPYGMAAVVLKGANKEKLQLAGGKTASITIPIPEHLIANAPATIPLWYFNEQKGVWMEEGSATKQNGKYTGTVSHFSFWSVDMPADLVNITIRYENKQAAPFAFHKIKFTEADNDSSYVYAFTDSTGTVNTTFPKGKSVKVQLLNGCNTVIYTENLVPFQEDRNLGTRIIEGFTTTRATIRGKVTDCSGNPLANAYVIVKNGFASVEGITDNAGNYIIPVNLCNNGQANVMIIAGNRQAREENSTPVYQQIAPGGDYTINPIKACGLSTEVYLEYLLDNVPFSFNVNEDRISCIRNNVPIIGMPNDTTTTINATNEALTKYGLISFTGSAAPSADTGHLGFEVNINTENGADIRGAAWTFHVKVTEYGKPGQFVAGSFASAMYDRKHLKYVQVSCRFRLRRTL